jgi:hypothetical protein
VKKFHDFVEALLAALALTGIVLVACPGNEPLPPSTTTSTVEEPSTTTTSEPVTKPEDYWPLWTTIRDFNFLTEAANRESGRAYPFHKSSWEDVLGDGAEWDGKAQQDLVWSFRNPQIAIRCPSFTWPFGGITRDRAIELIDMACALIKEKHGIAANLRLPNRHGFLGRSLVRKQRVWDWWAQVQALQYRTGPDASWGELARLDGIGGAAVEHGCRRDWADCQ